MPRFARLILALSLTALLAAGCMTVKTAVDPAYGTTKYEDIARPTEPYRWKVSVQFLRNGDPVQKAESTLRDSVERVLRASSVVIPTPDATSGEIRVVLNNVTDMKAAAAKGFGSGLTFGLVGTTVTDYYEMEVTIAADGRNFHKSGIRHALISAVGNKSLPEGLEPLPPTTAFNKLVEQMLLNALKEFQQSGSLSLRSAE